MNLTNTAYVLLAGLLPALLWLWFWIKEDNLHPEPKSLIAISFIAGCMSVLLAVVLEGFAKEIISDQNYRYLAWATIEEVVKFLAVAIIALRSKYLDEPIDAMIYCITVALGFAAVENGLFIFKSLDTNGVVDSIVTGNFRFIGATLVHIVSSASIGFMIGLSFYKGAFMKVISIIIGIILASTLHTSFNLAIINTTDTSAL
ncbi:MAG: PrsW family glutamic-type intramembrane protease, partial [Patescibacteria group bacterium]